MCRRRNFWFYTYQEKCGVLIDRCASPGSLCCANAILRHCQNNSVFSTAVCLLPTKNHWVSKTEQLRFRPQCVWKKIYPTLKMALKQVTIDNVTNWTPSSSVWWEMCGRTDFGSEEQPHETICVVTMLLRLRAFTPQALFVRECCASSKVATVRQLTQWDAMNAYSVRGRWCYSTQDYWQLFRREVYKRMLRLRHKNNFRITQ